jgi:hypothetical protein
LKTLFEEIEHRSQQCSYVGSFWHNQNFVLAERFACDLRDSAYFLFGQGEVAASLFGERFRLQKIEQVKERIERVVNLVGSRSGETA